MNIRTHGLTGFALLALASAACGSTATTSATGPVEAQPSAPMSSDGVTSDNAEIDQGLTLAPPRNGSQAPTAEEPAFSTPGTGSVPPPASPAGHPSPGGEPAEGPMFSPDARGVTDTEIAIGLGYQAGADEAIAATGAEASTGDQRRYYEVMLDFISTHRFSHEFIVHPMLNIRQPAVGYSTHLQARLGDRVTVVRVGEHQQTSTVDDVPRELLDHAHRVAHRFSSVSARARKRA